MRVFLLIVLLVAKPAIAENQTEAELFDRFKLISGAYHIKSEGSDSLVFYKLIAQGSVLMESWYSDTENEEITLFHMDNGRLVATHYCGVGIQATMELEWPNNKESGHFKFKLKSATNLPSIDTPHNSGFSYTFTDSQKLIREEVWENAGESSSSFLTLVKN